MYAEKIALILLTCFGALIRSRSLEYADMHGFFSDALLFVKRFDNFRAVTTAVIKKVKRVKTMLRKAFQI